jgi:hypothetical protein
MDVDDLTLLTPGQNDRFIMPSALSLVKEDRICHFSNEPRDRTGFGLVIIQPRSTTRSST